MPRRSPIWIAMWQSSIRYLVVFNGLGDGWLDLVAEELGLLVRALNVGHHLGKQEISESVCLSVWKERESEKYGWIDNYSEREGKNIERNRQERTGEKQQRNRYMDKIDTERRDRPRKRIKNKKWKADDMNESRHFPVNFYFLPHQPFSKPGARWSPQRSWPLFAERCYWSRGWAWRRSCWTRGPQPGTRLPCQRSLHAIVLVTLSQTSSFT